MCKQGDEIRVRVKIPADLSHSGSAYWKNAQIDRCIYQIVAALQNAGIDMRGSCCGHSKAEGYIDLQDGRHLIICGTACLKKELYEMADEFLKEENANFLRQEENAKLRKVVDAAQKLLNRTRIGRDWEDANAHVNKELPDDLLVLRGALRELDEAGR